MLLTYQRRRCIVCRLIRTLSERTTRPSHNHSGPRPVLPSPSLSRCRSISFSPYIWTGPYFLSSLRNLSSRPYNLRALVSSFVQTTRGACPSATRRDFGVPRDRRWAMTRRCATSSGGKGRSPRRFTRRSGDVRISLSLSLVSGEGRGARARYATWEEAERERASW